MIYCCLLQGDSFAIFHALFKVFCSVLVYICIFFPDITCLDEDIQKISEGGTLNWRDSRVFFRGFASGIFTKSKFQSFI